MAHEVETMAFVQKRGVPWHGLGNPLADLVDATAMRAASGLDWVVDQRPLFTTGIDGQSVKVEGKVANIRATDDQVLGVVGDRYKIIQNEALFDFSDALLDAGAVYETAGSLRNGKRVFISMEVPEGVSVAGDNGAVKSYVLVTNGHDGLHPMRAVITPVRVVCQNTLNAALGSVRSSFTLRHTAKMEGRVAQARTALGIAHNFMVEFREGAEQLIEKKISYDVADRLIASIFPAGEEEKEKGEKFSRRAMDTRAILRNAENLDGIRETGWGVYNAIAEYLDHGVKYRGGSAATAQDARAESILFDGYAVKTKEKALAAVRAA